MLKRIIAFLMMMCVCTSNSIGSAAMQAPSVTDSLQGDLTKQLDLDVNNDGIPDYALSIVCDCKSVMKLMEKRTVNYKYMTSSYYVYEIYSGKRKTATINFTLNQICNHDSVYFLDFYPSEKVNLQLNVKAFNMTRNFEMRNTYTQKGNNKEKFDQQVDFAYHGSNSNLAQIPNQSFYIDDKNSSKFMRLGNVYMVRDLGHTIYDLDLSCNAKWNLNADKSNLDFSFSLPVKTGYHTRTDGVLSAATLVNWANNFTVKTLQILGLNNNSLFWSDGMYVKNEPNYCPRSPSSLRKNISVSTIQSCHWVLNQGNLFQDIAITEMYAYSASYNKKGYIPEGPYSEWLKGDFNIGYNFYDTRFNSDSASALMYIYSDYPDDIVMNAIKKHIEFYMDYSNRHTIDVGGVLFVQDYMDYNENNKNTHASLNHNIAEMRMLYQYYDLSKDTNVLERAHRILLAICQTYQKWIRQDGDLWYKVTPEGKYEGNDYPLVTYNDLSCTQYFLNKVDGEVPKEWNTLFESKKAWAKKKGFL